MNKFPDFEGLAMFAKVAEEGSFAAAARVMGVSVPTVSRAVARLEQRLGGRLFNRTSRQLALTEFGQSMAAKASEMYRQAEEVESEAQELSVQPRGQVRLAVPMSFGLRWVAPLMPEIIRQFPELSVDLHLSDASVDLIAEGFDAALRIAALPDSSLVARKLCAVTQFLWPHRPISRSTVCHNIRAISALDGASAMPIVPEARYGALLTIPVRRKILSPADHCGSLTLRRYCRPCWRALGLPSCRNLWQLNI